MTVMRRTGPELTYRAITGILSALPAARYDVRAVPAEDSSATAELWHPGATGLMRLIPTLRARNAGGAHIYMRPVDTAYIVVDGLDADGLDALHAAGHVPAAVVLTSPHNHQAWLRLTDPGAGPPPEVATEAARIAAEHFGGDPRAIGATQLGRLPGTANKKWVHQRADGGHPFVLLLATSLAPDPAAADLLAEARARIAARQPSSCSTGNHSSDRRPSRLRGCSPAEEYAEARRRLLAALPPGASLDRSRLDHALAKRLLRRGASLERVARVLHVGERAAIMNAVDAQAYVARTVAAAQDAIVRQETDHGGGGKPGERGREKRGGRREAMKMLGNRTKRRREFTPAAGRTYVPSDLRAAVRRAGRWRVAQEAGALAPVCAETYAADILQRGRTAGLLGHGRRQQVIFFQITPEQVEFAARFTGARRLHELILTALISVVLKSRGARPHFADRRPPRLARHPRLAARRITGQPR